MTAGMQAPYVQFRRHAGHVDERLRGVLLVLRLQCVASDLKVEESNSELDARETISWRLG